MAEKGFECFDFRGGHLEAELTNGRMVKVRTPVVLDQGVTLLTDHLAIVTQKFRKKWENVAIKDGKVMINQFSDDPDYENFLTVDTK